MQIVYVVVEKSTLSIDFARVICDVCDQQFETVYSCFKNVYMSINKTFLNKMNEHVPTAANSTELNLKE